MIKQFVNIWEGHTSHHILKSVFYFQCKIFCKGHVVYASLIEPSPNFGWWMTIPSEASNPIYANAVVSLRIQWWQGCGGKMIELAFPSPKMICSLNIAQMLLRLKSSWGHQIIVRTSMYMGWVIISSSLILGPCVGWYVYQDLSPTQIFCDLIQRDDDDNIFRRRSYHFS